MQYLWVLIKLFVYVIDPPMSELLSSMICIARLLEVSFHVYLLIFWKFLGHVLLSCFNYYLTFDFCIIMLELNCMLLKSYQVKVLCL